MWKYRVFLFHFLPRFRFLSVNVAHLFTEKLLVKPLLLLLLPLLLLPSGWIVQNLTEFRLDRMHSLAHFASNAEILLPVSPLQHLIRAAKSKEALPVVPV